jgi:hypothetical protein
MLYYTCTIIKPTVLTTAVVPNIQSLDLRILIALPGKAPIAYQGAIMERRRPKFRRNGSTKPKHPVSFKAERRPVGLPSDYRAAYDDMVYKLRLAGLSVDVICSIMTTTNDRLELWREKIPSFREAWEEGGALADANVARKLYARATGYEHVVTKLFQYRGEVIEKDYVEKFAPETGAAMAWLTNRQPEIWRNRSTTALTNASGGDLLPPILIINPVKAITSEPRPVIDGDAVYVGQSANGDD